MTTRTELMQDVVDAARRQENYTARLANALNKLAIHENESWRDIANGRETDNSEAELRTQIADRDKVIASLRTSLDDAAFKLNAEKTVRVAVETENEKLSTRAARIHRLIGRGTHNDPLTDFDCALTGLQDILQASRENAEENEKLKKHEEELEEIRAICSIGYGTGKRCIDLVRRVIEELESYREKLSEAHRAGVVPGTGRGSPADVQAAFDIGAGWVGAAETDTIETMVRAFIRRHLVIKQENERLKEKSSEAHRVGAEYANELKEIRDALIGVGYSGDSCISKVNRAIAHLREFRAALEASSKIKQENERLKKCETDLNEARRLMQIIMHGVANL